MDWEELEAKRQSEALQTRQKEVAEAEAKAKAMSSAELASVRRNLVLADLRHRAEQYNATASARQFEKRVSGDGLTFGSQCTFRQASPGDGFEFTATGSAAKGWDASSLTIGFHWSVAGTQVVAASEASGARAWDSAPDARVVNRWGPVPLTQERFDLIANAVLYGGASLTSLSTVLTKITRPENAGEQRDVEHFGRIRRSRIRETLGVAAFGAGAGAGVGYGIGRGCQGGGSGGGMGDHVMVMVGIFAVLGAILALLNRSS